MDNLDFLYGCFNQYAFSLAKENIQNIEYYYLMNPNTNGNTLVKGLIGAIKEYDLDAIGAPLFQSILAKDGKNQAEQQEIMNKIIQYKQYTKEQIAPLKKHINDVVASVIFQKAQKFKDSPAELLKYLKNVNFKTDEIDYLKSTSFENLDVNSIIADSADDCIPSKFDFINRSFPGGGYNKGQIVIVSCPPGSGKTLFAMEEVLHMALNGYKCLYYAAGDMNYKDFLIRLGAQYTGAPFSEVARHIAGVYKELSAVLKDNLDICITPAGVVSPREFVDYVKNNPKKYDVVVIDYDSNLKIDTSDSMYDAFGAAYSTFSELTVDSKQNKLLFVLAQPKVSVWGEPVINLSDVGESSRKQHTADVIITRGRVIGCPNHVAPMKIVKNRRGEVDVVSYTIRLNNGRTKVVPREIYDDLKSVNEKRDYNEADIDQMVSNFRSARDQVRNRMTSRGNSGNGNNNQVKTPF